MESILKGRVAVVTGSGNGLGRAHAVALAERGALVVVNDLGTSADGIGASHDAADAVVKKIRDAGGNAVASYDSVADEEGAKKIIDLAAKTYGRLDILVNNAGIIRTGPVERVETKDWDAVVKTHLYGTFFCTRAAVPIMKQQSYGRIINTSSAVGFGLVNHAAYSASKEGITGFSRTMARELGKSGITCNVIRPIAAWRGTDRVLPAVDVNQPEDIAPLIVYLASEQAGNVNGCIFEVWRGHVGIFVDPPPVEQVVWKEGQWTADELMKVLPETLTRGKSRRSPSSHDAVLPDPNRIVASAAEPVSNPRLSNDELGPRWVGFDLVAQIADVHMEHVRLVVVRRSPDLMQQLPVRDHHSSVHNQHPKQAVLGGGQLHRVLGNTYRPVDQVDFQAAGDKHWPFATSGSPPQSGAETGEQFSGAKGLG